MPEWFCNLPPGLLMVVGALLLPVLGKRFSGWGALILALTSVALFWMMPLGSYGNVDLFGHELQLVRLDRLSWLFGLVFHLAAILAAIYALHVKESGQHVAAVMYAGGAIAASCAGDMISLFVFWELTAIASVFLVWASGGKAAYRAGMRYLIIQVGSGVLLLSGSIIRFVEEGTLSFGAAGEMGVFDHESLSGTLILLAFGIKAAFPLLHNWLQDAYPKATVTGTVYLSAFTTKLAIYSLARGFAGTEMLIWIGCAMTLFPIVFAVIENDLRKVLAYSLNNQLGFMVVGIGIGSELALNGTAAHAFCHIIYKSLLFMSMGAVLKQAGTCKASELGGLHKSMPWTTVFCVIGAASISGFPLLSGFISKSMIITAAAEHHMFWVWIVLLIASAGVMEHSGIKIPFFAFFAHDSGRRPGEAPWNMLLAMALAAALCIGLGLGYQVLYRWLPFEGVEYSPFTTGHVVLQLQLLLFAALAFVFLTSTGLYPEEKPSTNLDTDWTYRKLLPWAVGGVGKVISGLDRSVRRGAVSATRDLNHRIGQAFNETGLFGRPWTTSAMAVWAAFLLGLFLILYYY